MWETLAGQLKASLHQAAFSSYSNQYFSVARNGDHSVSAERWMRNTFWETFTLKDWNGGALESGDTVTLQAHDGLYLSVDRGPSSRLYARSSLANRAERFTIRKIAGAGPIFDGDSVTLQSALSNRYLAPEVGGRGAIRALRTAPGPAEVFKLVVQEE
jgi:hypothetical protein